MTNNKEIEKIDKCISELVYDKSQIKKAYNYYHCVRDAEQFKYLEKNFGIGVPTSVKFTPLAKQHIDVLIGEYLSLDPELQVTCKDEDTISSIIHDKKNKIDSELYRYLKKYLRNSLINVFYGDQNPQNDPFVEKEMQKIKENIDKTFVSDYEIAAQNILHNFKCSRDIDLKNKMKELGTDLLICGICYYRTKLTSDGKSVKLETLNPIDTFIERNNNSCFLNKSPRAVVRRWLSPDQILLEFGPDLTNDAKNRIKKELISYESDNSQSIYVRAGYVDVNYTEVPKSSVGYGVLGGLEVTPIYPWSDLGESNISLRHKLPVYECEWLEYENDKLVRHEGVKIGDDIYITKGVAEHQFRSISEPRDCKLSVNGIFFLDKNGSPFSIVLNTMDLQD